MRFGFPQGRAVATPRAGAYQRPRLLGSAAMKSERCCPVFRCAADRGRLGLGPSLLGWRCRGCYLAGARTRQSLHHRRVIRRAARRPQPRAAGCGRRVAPQAVRKSAGRRRSRRRRAPPVRRFVAWLGEHPEVVAVSLVDDTPIARLRYSDGARTVVGAVYNRAVCIRHGSPVHGLGLAVLAAGRRALAARSGRGAGPITAAWAPPWSVSRGNGASASPRSRFAVCRGAAVYRLWRRGQRGTGQCASSADGGLPAWAGEARALRGVLWVAAKGQAASSVDNDGTNTKARAVGWRCWPPLPRPQLVEAEPDVPPQDRRLPSDGGARAPCLGVPRDGRLLHLAC